MRIMKGLAAWAAVLGMPAVAWVLARTAWALWDGRGPVAPVDDLVAMGAACIGAAVAGYLAMTGWAMLLGALVRGGRSVPRSVAALAPVSWQRVTATALGVTMSAGLAAPALASQPSAPHVGWGETVAVQTPSPAHFSAGGSPAGWTSPIATTTPSTDGGTLAVGFAPAPAPSPPAVAPPAPSDSSTYTVERGDSLWRITATLLGPEASDNSINRAWPELYAANYDAIGSDPALIHPGLVLTVPQEFQS